MSTRRFGDLLTYRRHSCINGMWVGLVKHETGERSVKVFNMQALATFIGSVSCSASLAAMCMPLPVGCSWDFCWAVGATGDVTLQLRAFDDDRVRSGVLLEQRWRECYDDLFFRRVVDECFEPLRLVRAINDVVAVRAQLNFGFIKEPARERKRVLRPAVRGVPIP